MARSDLLVSLVKAGVGADKRAFRSTTEAIIAEERAKRHNVLADTLTEILARNGSASVTSVSLTPLQADVHPRTREFISDVVPRRRLGELVLPATARRAVDSLIEEQLRADVLRAHGVEPRHRILLVGAPGTGKTTLAEAIAEALGVSFFVVRYEAIIGSYLGETATRLKRVFEYARTTPCVLFFDEFDAIGKERGDVHETGEIKRVVTSLLMQVDDLPSYTVVAAATNHPELLDRATWRRFQLRLVLPLPNLEALALYLQAFSERIGESFGVKTASIARRLGRISYAEAEEFCLDVQRRLILAMGEVRFRAIVEEQVELWQMRARAHEFGKGGMGHGRAPSTYSSGPRKR